MACGRDGTLYVATYDSEISGKTRISRLRQGDSQLELLVEGLDFAPLAMAINPQGELFVGTYRDVYGKFRSDFAGIWKIDIDEDNPKLSQLVHPSQLPEIVSDQQPTIPGLAILKDGPFKGDLIFAATRDYSHPYSLLYRLPIDSTRGCQRRQGVLECVHGQEIPQRHDTAGMGCA